MKSPRAFTLTELLVVVAVVGVLAGLAIPVVGSVRENARATECLSNLRQLAAGGLLYAQDHGGKFPSSRLYHGSNFTEPGITDYLNASKLTRVFKCPELAGYPFGAAYVTDTGGDTYTVSVTTMTDTLTPTNPVALTYMNRVQQPARTAWIMDGAWEGDGLYFASRIDRRQLGAYLDKLQWPHRRREHVAFVDGHVGAVERAAMTDAASTFWTGQ